MHEGIALVYRNSLWVDYGGVPSKDNIQNFGCCIVNLSLNGAALYWLRE